MRYFLESSLRVAGLVAVAAATGCSSGSHYQPGPVAGATVGTGVGLATGNVVGFGAGVASGTASGFRSVFNPNYKMVRYWRAETTPDGRTIQVPYDILVDEYGRPVCMPAPTGNPAPPPISTSAPAGTNLPTVH
jgi:hypothetical protein